MNKIIITLFKYLVISILGIFVVASVLYGLDKQALADDAITEVYYE